MRLFRWAILIGELVLLALALAVPRADLPQTAFDEADAPVNQATVMVVLSCRVALSGLRSAAGNSRIIVSLRQAYPTIISDYNPQPAPLSRSLLALLCTLLC